MTPQPLKILYEDNHLIAVLKPAGIPVQGDMKGSRSLMDDVKDYLKEKYNKEGDAYLGLVHRIDRPVSGVVVFGKTSKGSSRLSEQFRNRETIKIYYALAEGKFDKPSGTLTDKILKDSKNKKAFIVKDKKDKGDIAELDYETLNFDGKDSVLKIILKTGRFHQIRAQLANAGHPIVGDVKYGGRPIYKLGVIALTAGGIKFKKATGEEDIDIRLPIPNILEDFIGK